MKGKRSRERRKAREAKQHAKPREMTAATYHKLKGRLLRLRHPNACMLLGAVLTAGTQRRLSE